VCKNIGWFFFFSRRRRRKKREDQWAEKGLVSLFHSNGVKTLERKSCNAAEMRGQLIDRSSGT